MLIFFLHKLSCQWYQRFFFDTIDTVVTLFFYMSIYVYIHKYVYIYTQRRHKHIHAYVRVSGSIFEINTGSNITIKAAI